MVKDLVLIGGGHAHLQVLKEFGRKSMPGVRLILICKDVMAPYSGMLPGLIAGHYSFRETHIDLRPLARLAGAEFYRDLAVGLDLTKQQILCKNRPPVSYDLVSIDIGSVPVTDGVPGALEHGVAVKPIDQFLLQWEKLRSRVLARRDQTRIGVVGGGAGGVEVLLAIHHRLTRDLTDVNRTADHLEFHLFTDSPEILPAHNPRVRGRFRCIFQQRQVLVHTARRVSQVEPGFVHCDNGLRQSLDEILWVTSADAASWLAAAGLAVDGRGFIQVNDFLQSISHPTVFAAGDIAAMVNHPRPKAGVFAVRQGPPLAENLRRALLGGSLRPFLPQEQCLSLLTTGNRYAIASRSHAQWALGGVLVWYWKRWIDRRFVAAYRF